MSILGAAKVHHLSLHYPDTGSPRADVVLTGGAAPTIGARLTLTASDLPVVMTVLRSDDDAPERPHAVLVGGIGWENEIATPPSYQADAGVKLSTVLTDLAKRATSTAMPGGEPIELPSPDVTIGDHWTCPASRPGDPLRLRDVLAALYEQGFAPPWRVDPDGVTRFGLRVGSAVTARTTVMRRDAGVGLVVFGLDSPAAFLPGAIIDDGKVIRRLVVTETPSELTAEAWTDARLSFRARLLRMVAEAFPSLVYGHPRTYRVKVVRMDGRLDLVPPPDAAHLAALPAVEAWTPYGIGVTPAVGSAVVVGFRDALPSRPFVIGYAPTAAGPAAARKGDLAVRLYFDTFTSTLYKSESIGAPYAWTPVLGAIIPPDPTEAGTPVTIAAGSSIVTLK